MTTTVTSDFEYDHPMYPLMAWLKKNDLLITSLQITNQQQEATLQSQFDQLQKQAEQIQTDQATIGRKTEQILNQQQGVDSLTQANAQLSSQVGQLQAQVQSLIIPSQQHKAASVINTGLQYYGVPYMVGGIYEQNGAFDCSSFVQYVFAQNDIHLPQFLNDQAQVGTTITLDMMQPADLAFFDANQDGTINHVGIYFGNGLLLHITPTDSTLVGVHISKIDDNWKKQFVTARSVLV